MMTVLWSTLVIISAWQVRETGCIFWFWEFPLQSYSNISPTYLTVQWPNQKHRFGEVGILHGSLSDFVFQCALIVLRHSPPEMNLQWWFFAILAITSGFMVNSFLSLRAMNLKSSF